MLNRNHSQNINSFRSQLYLAVNAVLLLLSIFARSATFFKGTTRLVWSHKKLLLQGYSQARCPTCQPTMTDPPLNE